MNGDGCSKLICINLPPNTATQAPERDAFLIIGGFIDSVFGVVADFLADDAGRLVAEVDAVELFWVTPWMAGPAHATSQSGP
ncbi:MAG TPA: hypothetical protein VND64_33585 [Pirellulales bacterium]|nr:hypothetical protein [Pirellulales bacterium]